MFIFNPMHVNKKTGEFKPSLFDHTFSTGRSVQRDTLAKDEELTTFVTNFLNGKSDRKWLGVLTADFSAIKRIKLDHNGRASRATCVFDTAEPGNPAHAEICQTHFVIEEADRAEVRRHMMAAFGEGAITSPQDYRGAAILQGLPAELRG